MVQFLEIPLDLAQDILEQVGRDADVKELLQLRSVCRLFDYEITKIAARHRLQEVYKRIYPTPWSNHRLDEVYKYPTPWSDLRPNTLFLRRLIYENLRARQVGPSELKTFISNVNDHLLDSLRDLNIHTTELEVMHATCSPLFDKTSLDEVVWYLTPECKEDGKYWFLNRLLPWRWDPKDITKYIFTVAVIAPYTEVYDAMLRNGFDPYLVTENFRSPLESLARLNRVATLRRLLDSRTSACPSLVTRLLRDSFTAAVTLGNVDTVRLLLEPKYGLVQNSLICLKGALRAIRGPGCAKEQQQIAKLVLEPHPVLPQRWRRMRTVLCILAARYGLDWIMDRYLTPDINATEVIGESFGRGNYLSFGECYPSVPEVQNILNRVVEIRGTPEGVSRDCLKYFVRKSNFHITTYLPLTEQEMKEKYYHRAEHRNVRNVKQYLMALQYILRHGQDFQAAGPATFVFRKGGESVRCSKVALDRWLEMCLNLKWL